MGFFLGVLAAALGYAGGLWAMRRTPTAFRGWRVGALLAAGLCIGHLGYPWRRDLRIVGVPIPAAAYQYDAEQELWLDYVGPLTGPILIVNGGACAGAIAAGIVWWRNRRHRSVQGTFRQS